MAKFENKSSVIFLATSNKQLEMIVNVVERRLRDLEESCEDEFDADDIAPERAAMFNFLCDLNVKGYEI